MNKIVICSATLLAVLLVSCLPEVEKNKNTGIIDENIDIVEAPTTIFNKDELALLIPKEIQGYIPNKEPRGLDMELLDASFSFTTQYYYNENDSINIELFDYLDCQMEYYRYAQLWWDNGTEVDNEKFSAKYVSLEEEVHSWVVFDKPNKRTTVYVGVDNRFYLIFECFGKENTDFIERVAKEFDYDKLR